MTESRILGIGTTLMAVLVSTTWAQAPKGLTARELFYSAPAVTKSPAAIKPPAKPQAEKPPQKEQTVAKAAPRTKPVADPGPAHTRPTEMEARLPGGGSLVKASNSNAAPLGLRYSILKYTGEDDYVEVNPEYVFHSGDKIRLRVQVNDPGYLYVVMQGTSGAWRVMFPAPEIDAGSNHVVPNRLYDLPGKTRMFFDEQAGTEKLFVILSRQPLKEMDQVIYDLDAGKKVQSAPASEAPKSMMASAAIGNPLVSQMRGGVMARDLVFEKVDESKPAPISEGGRKETATYVVNASLSADSRLVADINLKHR
ncbi:DUF4384 domain-containing protein [uncultured Paludibaculum sp.]|uniref:DUF4384 domain-containing protein n=1 Tax=uncultured Paludibaculum sp. TaxID=1765020 RepID=UPI002AAB54F1|nr:DUF4384 domain-containing protein [uncultured Paludibaculum sp.]